MRTFGKCICNVNRKLTYSQVREFVMKFLMGLNKSFAQVKTQVLLMDPLPHMTKVYSLLIQEEMQRNFGNGSYSRVESTGLALKGQNFTFNASSGHGINPPKGKERPQCTKCGKLGHTTNKCYKLHGFPPSFKFKNKNSMAHQVSSTD